MDVDYYSIDSDTIETINILRPPVTRCCRNTRQDLIDYFIGDSNNVNVTRDTLYKQEKQKTSKHIKRTEESSLSLVLQKACKREIIEKYSLFNCDRTNIGQTNSHENICEAEDKPLIRVSVIPKTNQNNLINVSETLKKVTKTIQKPKSKDENSIQTKNLYVVVAGKSEKIYEIKTTGSAKVFRDAEDDDVKELYFNKKRRNKFYNMERKKHKSVKERKKEVDNYSDLTLMPCICKCTQPNFIQDTYPESSRVKILGSIRRNEDDKYVMKCAATVNGLPVATEYDEENDNNIFYNSLNDNKYQTTTKESQATQVDIKVNQSACRTCDQNVQCNACDVCIENNCCKNFGMNNLKATNSPLVIISVYPKQESNGFAVKMPNMSLPERSFIRNHVKHSNNLREDIRLKDAVTVSTDIYSTRENSPKENFGRKINGQSYQPRQAYKKDDIRDKAITVNANFDNSQKLSRDSRNNHLEANVAGQNSNTRRKRTTISKTNRASRSASPANRTIKPKIVECNKQITTDANVARTDARNKSPPRVSINDKRQQSIMDVSKTNKKVTVNKRTEIKEHPTIRSRSGSRSRDKGVNTDKTRINNMLDSRYTKKTNEIKKQRNNKKETMPKNEKTMSKQSKFKKTFLQSNISKVSVNIDSEKEYYDVIFEKGKLNTDLIVRQTVKDNSSQKYFEQQFDDDFEEYFNESHKSDSLENYFPLEALSHHRRSVSQAYNNIFPDAIPLSEHMSRLNVRDSLEIKHRRDKNNSHTHANKRHLDNNTNDNGRDFFAPVKHYTGDSCTICDPVERDKEIRELLGVNNIRTEYEQTGEKEKDIKKSETFVSLLKLDDNQSDKVKHNDCSSCPISSHCFFQSKLCESISANEMLQKSCSCSSCNRIKLPFSFEQNSRDVPKRAIKKSDVIDLDSVITKSDMKNREQEKEKKIYKQSKGPITVNNRSRVPILIHQTFQYETLEKSYNNHNIQDFLNVEPCLKRKAILLSRKQYTKVKKTINKVTEKHIRRKIAWNSSIVSIGGIKAKTKSEYLMHMNKEMQTDPVQEIVICQNVKKLKKENFEAGDNQNNTVVLFTRHKEVMNNETMNKEVRKVTSSIEIRYTSISYMKEPTCSFTNVGSLGSSNLERKRHQSIETLFRGHRKSRTPNLGASALSLLTEHMGTVSKSEKSLCPDSKPKKPFLRRLMSCLVMHAGKSVVKIGESPKAKPSTMNSSYDSYHISTSLGAIEMGSSLYDTSASFYSNHTIGPINNKMKRGFFSSVRGFLAARKS